MVLSSSNKQTSTRLYSLASTTLMYALGVETTCFLVEIPSAEVRSD